MTPVLDKNEVYTAYEAFVKLGDSVRVGHPPKGCDEAIDGVHVGKRWRDGQYYYVPKKYAVQFFHLCLRTSVKRGPLEGESTAAIVTSSTKKPSRAGASSTPAHILPALKSPDASPQSTKTPELKALEDAAQELRQMRLESH